MGLLRWDGAQVGTADTVFPHGIGNGHFGSAECLAHLVLQSCCNIAVLPIDSVFVCVKGREKIVWERLSVREFPRFKSALLLSDSAVRSVETS